MPTRSSSAMPFSSASRRFMPRATMRPSVTFCSAVRDAFDAEKARFSSSSRPKARITRTPDRFSRVCSVSLSSTACMRLYMGEVRFISVNTMTDSRSIVNTNITDTRAFTAKAIIIAPNTIKGERRNRRRNRLSPFCTWFMSPVMRVISVSSPIASRREASSAYICAIRSRRIRAAQPVAARAAKYCAAKLHTRPVSASASSRKKHCFITAGLLSPMPTFIMRATISGTNRSNSASSILNAGASMLSRR